MHANGSGLRGAGELEAACRKDWGGPALFWIDVADPNPADMARVGREFGLHPLAIEDAVRRHERPKIDLFDDYVFIVFYALEMDGIRVVTREVSLFAGPHWVVTVHEGALPVLAETARRWEEHDFGATAPGAGLLVYALLDAIVDGYFPVVDALADRADGLEAAVFAGPNPGTQAEIFALKKDLLAVRRVVAPEREVMNVIVRRDVPLFAGKELTYFQDVYDHLLRVTDSIDVYRDLCSSALDASVSISSYRLNDVVKRMTSGSIILMSMTLVAGVYGMNFAFMPELDWRFGYPFALGLMAAIGASLAWFFHRIDWL